VFSRADALFCSRGTPVGFNTARAFLFAIVMRIIECMEERIARVAAQCCQECEQWLGVVQTDRFSPSTMLGQEVEAPPMCDQSVMVAMRI